VEVDHIWKTRQQVKIYVSLATFPQGRINTEVIAPVISNLITMPVMCNRPILDQNELNSQEVHA
jgi:hypothetical protein